MAGWTGNHHCWGPGEGLVEADVYFYSLKSPFAFFMLCISHGVIVLSDLRIYVNTAKLPHSTTDTVVRTQAHTDYVIQSTGYRAFFLLCDVHSELIYFCRLSSPFSYQCGYNDSLWVHYASI